MIVSRCRGTCGTRLRALGFFAVVSAVMYVTVPGLLGSIRGLFSNAGQDPSIASRTGSYDIAGEFIAGSPSSARASGRSSRSTGSSTTPTSG